MRNLIRRFWPAKGRHRSSGLTDSDRRRNRQHEELSPLLRAWNDADKARAVEHAGADDAYVEELHALVEEVKAEQNGEREPLPLTGELTDAERQAVVAAIQSETTEIPIVDPLFLLERDTQRWFDEAFAGVVEQYDDEFAMVLAQLVDDEELQTALLRLARSQRDENAQTVELLAVSV